MESLLLPLPVLTHVVWVKLIPPSILEGDFSLILLSSPSEWFRGEHKHRPDSMRVNSRLSLKPLGKRNSLSSHWHCWAEKKHKPGVAGGHLPLQRRARSEVKIAQSWPTLQPMYSPWNSLVQNTGVGSLSLLQDIFPTWGSNPGLPHCRRILYHLSYKGSPILH